MTLTLQTIEAHIRHTLGGDSSVEGNGRTIANQAGHYWASMHDWRCMERLGRINLRASVTITGATWAESTRLLTKTAGFTSYTLVQGDQFQVTSGTGATVGYYPIQSRSSADAIVLQTSIGAAADTQTNIAGTIDCSSCALPADFRQLIGRPKPSGSSRSMEVVGPEELLELRSNTVGGQDSAYYGAIMSAPSAAVLGGAPAPRLEIWPAPASAVTSAFTMHYRAGWTNLTDDGDVAAVPAAFAIEMLYLRVVRAIARAWEEEDTGSMSARLLDIKAGPDFLDAVRADGSVQTNLGQMRGGAAGAAAPRAYNFTFQPPS